MDRVRIGPVKGLRIAMAAFVISVFLFVAVIVGGAVLFIARSEDNAQRSQENAQFAKELRNGLVANCEANGNPLREVLIEEQHEAILSLKDPRLPQLLPTTPPAIIEQIVLEGNAQHRERIKKLMPVDCSALYPAIP